MTRTGLDEARAAVERGDWLAAVEALDRGIEPGTDAAAWELRAMALYGLGELEGSVAAWEALHDERVRAGDSRGAARAAAMIAMYLMMDTGLMSPVRGWLRRSERHLESSGDVPERALVAMTRTYERFMCGDMAGAAESARDAIALGTRHGIGPAVVIGRTASARVLIIEGHVAEGLALLDEVGALLMSGRVDPLTTGMMLCELICAAQGLAQPELAHQWTDVMERWRHGAAFGGINGRCRVHRAEMLRFTGPCDVAETEALRACDELRPWMRREFGWPLAELGNIRLRRGDLDGAEEAFVAAHAHAWSPHPGLALVHLMRGDADTAAALIAGAIEHPLDIPSKERPPFGDLRLAPLLDAQVEIAASVGDVPVARRAAEQLAAIAASYPSEALRAGAALARGRVALLESDASVAIEQCRDAVARWVELGGWFEAAVARTVLGDALHRAGSVDLARLEWGTARAAFERYGALVWAERAAERLAGAVPDTRPRPDGAGPVAVFRLDGSLRLVEFAGRAVRLRDLTGFHYLDRLLADAGREFHVLDLVAVEHGTLPTVPSAHVGADGLAVAVDRGLPVIDERARDAYRRRLAEVEADIDEAHRLNDPGRAELAERDRDYLVAELRQAVGLGGRHRSIGGTVERARTSVARSLRYAIGRLAEHQPELAAHLGTHVRTGVYCSYEPDPIQPIRWER